MASPKGWFIGPRDAVPSECVKRIEIVQVYRENLTLYEVQVWLNGGGMVVLNVFNSDAEALAFLLRELERIS